MPLLRSSLPCALVLLACGCAARDPISMEAESTLSVDWIADLQSARREALRDGKPLVVCYMAPWCAECRRFRKRTLASDELNALSDRFVWVLLDVDRDLTTIRSEKIGVTPTTDVFDPSGMTRLRIEGFMHPSTFVKRLEEFERAVQDEKADPARQELEGSRNNELPRGYRGAGICYSNVGFGPLRLPSLSPFQSLRFGMMPRTPSTLAKGSIEAQWTESWANLWARDGGEHLVDYEILRSSISLAYGVSDVVQVELAFVQASRFGGVMDGFIEGFHDLFGLSQGGRDDAPRDDFALQVLKDDGSPAATLTNRDRGSFTESLTATFQHNLTCGTRFLPAFSYAVSLRSELGEQENFTDGEHLDLGVSISGAKRVGDFYGYFGLGYSWFGHETFEDIELRERQLTALFALEWEMSPRASLVVQYLYSQGVAESAREFSDPSYELTFGGKFEIQSGLVLEVGLLENAITFDNSPDFGLHAGLLFRY